MRTRLLPAIAFASLLMLGHASAARAQQQQAAQAQQQQASGAQPAAQSSGDGAQPLTEYDDVPPGLMMMKTKAMAEKTAPDADASDNGGADQIMNMADIQNAYQRGEYALAAAHLKTIANDSYPDAEELLGIMYLNGQGVKKNPGKAIKLLTSAANAGRGLAAHYLGIVYYTGNGVQQNVVTATMWLYIAVNNNPAGNPDKARAQSDLDNMLAQIGRRQSENAYGLAQSWLQDHNMTSTIAAP